MQGISSKNNAKGAFAMLKNNKTQQGFTIIEVLIVLAIAGLMMLIVFMAVPALQRNSRNTQYKNDASALVTAATEFSNNNNGKVPVTADNSSIQSLAKTQSITTLAISTGTTAVTPATTFDRGNIVTGVKCPTTVGGTSITPVASATRSLIIVYAVENSSGGVVAQCLEG